MTSHRHGIGARALALFLCAWLGPLSCLPAPVVAPASGLAEYRAYGLIPVPGGFVDAVGGNLMLSGVGISLDTPLGTWGVETVWNAAAGAWQWSHLVRYDGTSFVDPSGAVLDTAALPDGAPIPGTGWTRVDAQTLRGRGGLAWHFGADGRLEHVRWTTLAYPRIAFGAAQISQCVSASVCSALFTLELHASGQPVRVRDARSGREARFDYDDAGRLVAGRTPEDVAQGRSGARYAYDGAQLVATTSSEGERVEYAYQAGGRIRRVVQRGEGDPAHVFDFYGRNAWGLHRTVHTNPLGGHTTVYFDEQRRVLHVARQESGEGATLDWEGLRPTRHVDAGGAVTELGWQGERLVSLVTPAGNRIRFTHAPAALSPDDPQRDPILRVEDDLGLVEARSYDASGRPIAIENGAGEIRTLGWSGANVVAQAGGGVAMTFPSFGAHGHWLDAWIGGEVVARRAFDLIGNEVVPRETRRAGGLLGLGFDADRRVRSLDVAASDEAGRVAATAAIEIARRSDGEPTAYERPGGGSHHLLRDALGRVVLVRERAESGWRDTHLEYDAMGNGTARELANGMREEWDYDPFGRVVAHRALRGGVLEGEETFSWQAGRLAARTDSLRSGGEVFLYDAAGRTSSVVFGYGETISYEYDQRGRRVRELYSIPGVGAVADIGSAYDGADRRTALTDRTTGAPLVAWRHEDGRIAGIDTANGLRRTFTYDARGQLVAQETRDAQGGAVESTRIAREFASAPPRLEVRTATTTPVAQTEERYWLPTGGSLASPDQRVGRRVFGWSAGAGSATRRYAWDELGNRVGTAAGDDFVYDAERARLLFASLEDEGESIVYLYDEAGFVTSRDGVPLTWTATGRLASHGADAIAWDMAGRPIAITESGVTREFRFFGGRIEGASGGLGALDLGDVVLALGSGARRWRHFDFRGQVSFVSDEAGDVVAHYRYQPFGVDAAFGPEAGGGRFENRPAFGPFFLLGARVLDPSVGRFLSPDPVLQPGSQYAYAYGNPIDFEDADGMLPAARVEGGSPGMISGFFKVVGSVTMVVGAAVGGTLTIGATATIGGAMIAWGTFIDWWYQPGMPGGPVGDGGGGNAGGGDGSPGCGCTKELEFDIAGPTVVVAPTSVGCAPLGLTQRSDELQRPLLVLLVINALVAAAWWGTRRRRVTRCSRMG
ncbi:MAG TPA: RHS repeat-associated core domain-containing protein [Myxococcota bacterium]|nr:RHS repeat-associated core domain-containing protein [Myxococcota bacterium]